jgi:hypothetical protein
MYRQRRANNPANYDDQGTRQEARKAAPDVGSRQAVVFRPGGANGISAQRDLYAALSFRLSGCEQIFIARRLKSSMPQGGKVESPACARAFPELERVCPKVPVAPHESLPALKDTRKRGGRARNAPTLRGRRGLRCLTYRWVARPAPRCDCSSGPLIPMR